MVLKAFIVAFLASFLLASAVSATEMRIIGALKGDTSAQRFGDACEGLGDINGDGYNDFLVAEFTNQKLHLYLGGLHPFDNPPVITWNNHGSGGGLESFSPQAIGDIDCDGVMDFISIFGENPIGMTNADTLKLFTGLETQSFNEFLTFLPAPFEDWAPAVTGGGDNNNDGQPDFWFFNYQGSDNDTIWGYSGCDLLDNIPDYNIIASWQPDMKYNGVWGLCSTCDINGDSIPDLIYGQPTGYSQYPGRVCIVWGGQLSTSPDLVFYAPWEHAGNGDFGQDLTCLADISGDGIDDLWVSQGGRNYIFHGGRPFDTIPDLVLDWSFMYADVENIGDINNDGWNDVALFRDDYLINRVSFIYCYPGMDTLVDVVYSDNDFYNYLQLGSVCCFGIDHSWVGDVDGDGIDDALLSARETDADHLDNGWIVVLAGWDGYPVDVEENEDQDQLPNTLQLQQNFPNPFNSGTTIEFAIPRSGYTEIKIFNILGEVVAIPIQQYLSAGEHQVIWDGKDVTGFPTATGIYFYQVISGSYSETRKMVLLK
jgi:hypothetical protein